MAKVVGVRFRNVGKTYYFDPRDLEIHMGDHVIVETARGMEYGKIVLLPREVSEKEVVRPLKEIIRMATPEDTAREKLNREREDEAYRLCQKKIREHGLDMKLIDAEYTFDNKKILFYFTADGRIDFRQLVKDLAAVFKTRIELRQIGVRDETKILGGIGICGRCLCCHTYLSDFAPVSIKMAKEQNLSLNQTKISGVCGRLMCCLKNEQETYEELNKKLPGMGDYVEMADGVSGIVSGVNVLRELVKVTVEENDEKELKEYPASEIVFHTRRKKGKNPEAEGKNQENKGQDKKNQDRKNDKSQDSGDNKKQENKKQSDSREDSKKSEEKRTEKKNDEKRRERRDNRKGENRRQEDKKQDGAAAGEKNGEARPDDKKPEGKQSEEKRSEKKRSGRRRDGRRGESRKNGNEADPQKK